MLRGTTLWCGGLASKGFSTLIKDMMKADTYSFILLLETHTTSATIGRIGLDESLRKRGNWTLELNMVIVELIIGLA
ncbi:hypothetical protein VNO78_18796 [Psophocarpus tetragonolobus]|uniref:Uncharacterized protein n=1 Tax=Psophocarpus tetragonolobus TaxID=3891 RepID=A0AAN9SB97_PSOTE